MLNYGTPAYRNLSFTRSKDSPITRKRSGSFFTPRNFSVSPAFDDDAYPLPVVTLPSPPPKESSYELRLG